MRQKKSRALKLRMYGFSLFAGCGNAHDLQQRSRLALKFPARRIEKLLLLLRRCTAKKKCVDMNGPVSRGPFQALQPPRDVFRGRDLAATVTRQLD
jgi:hypothetical protein